MNMQARTVPLAVFAFLCLAIMGEAIYYSPMLPERLATQFGFDGMPNNWEDKSKFIFDLAGFLALLGIAFVAAELILRGIASVPGGLIFLPNKRFWLAPERRDETIADLGGWLRWFLVLTLALMAFNIGLALRANLFDPPRMPDAALWLTIAYLIVAVAMLANLVRHFYNSKR